MQRISRIIFVIALLSASFYAQASSLRLTKKVVQLSRTPFNIFIYSSGRPGNTYFHPHDDERTALVALKKMAWRYGGKVITLSHGGRRLVRFHLGRQLYIFDPNRIYTNVGIRRTLRKYGRYSDAAFKAVQNLSKTIVRMLPTNIIITAHNNKPQGYSYLYYKKGNKLARNAKKVFGNPKHDESNFIYVTEVRLYNQLLPYKFNLVLQNRRRVIDDGSLSVYALKHNIPYINVEAGYGNLSHQLAMLIAVHEIAKAY